MNKYIKFIKEYLYELLGKDIECCLHFDKWNNSLMIETKEKSK